jgi:antirestriction protein ArdC
MPNPKSFVNSEAYFSVLYHEAIHATGHRKRLNRHEKLSNLNFNDSYSVEELVAEMGAAYLCEICGIENATIDNSAAYIQGWLKKLKSDKKFIVSASGLAQKAVDYILENQKRPSLTKPVQVKRKRRKKVKPMALAL